MGDMPELALRALLFDVFGTVVDWRGSLAREVAALGQAHAVEGDWDQLVRDWHAEGYQGGMARVRRGEQPFTSVAALHRAYLDTLLPRYGLTDLDAAEIDSLTRSWRRLDPWPDSVAGLTRLKARYIIAPLSNGDFGMLVDLAKYARLPWDAIFAA
jgi:2-haloacid dehalogenase